MLLFPEMDQEEAHVSFVILNLESTVLVSKNYIQVPINKTDFVKCLHGGACSFGLSRVVDVTGSDYIVANINSSVIAISMTTGNEVMAKSEPGWVGCHLNVKKGQIPPTSKLQVSSTCKGMQVLLYAQRHNSAILLQLRDENTKEQRMRTYRAFQKWMRIGAVRESERSPATLQTMRRFCWTFERHSDVHVECFMESVVRELVEVAIQAVDGPFSEEQIQAFHAEDIEIPFLRKTARYLENNEEESVSSYSEK